MAIKNKLEMESNIQIVEKPDWVSWEEIKQCLTDAHAVNRARGINMTHYQWPADRIKDFLGENGVMLVALDENKVVGTAAIAEQTGNGWYARGRYAYLCFAGILPDYGGRGIYKALFLKREALAASLHYNVLLFDTHLANTRVQGIATKNGYRYIGFFQARSKDHYNVVMAKWLGKCPHSRLYCWWRYQRSKLRTLVSSKILHH